jgi:S1-C subfamily serine protease
MTTRAVDPLLLVALLGLGVLLTAKPPTPVATIVDPSERWRTAVNVGWIGYDEDREPQICSGGSGGLLGAVDLVVTNEHVSAYDAEYLEGCDDPYLAVGYSFDAKDDRFVWFPATERFSSYSLDIAVLDVKLQVEPWFEGGPEDIAPLRAGDWPVLKLADLEPRIGDPIGTYGFPSIGGYTITFTSGHVAGWVEDYAQNRSGMMKVDLNITHGSSGSLVLNQGGDVVGLVALLGIPMGEEEDSVDCTILADTNLDGEIDDDDTCVSVGGFINSAVSLEQLRKFLSQKQVIEE